MTFQFSIGIQAVGAIVLTADELLDDMLVVQIVTPGAQLSCTTLGALKSYIKGAVGLIDNGGFLLLDGPQPGWPTSDAGLPPGSYFSNGLYVCVTPGGTLSGAPLFFPGVTSSSLLAAGTGPLFNSPLSMGQLFINGGFVCVAGGTTGLVNNNGFLMLDGAQPGWPTDDSGLPPGSCFSNNLFVNVTPGGTAAGAPLVYPGVTAAQLLANGAAPLIASPQVPGSGQLFINGGFVCVA